MVEQDDLQRCVSVCVLNRLTLFSFGYVCGIVLDGGFFGFGRERTGAICHYSLSKNVVPL